MTFELEKWYLDVVAPGGRCWIGYWARLSMGPLRLSYAAELCGGVGCPVEQRRRLAASGAPRESKDAVEWQCVGLGVEGRWDRAEPCFERRLLGSDGGVLWRCAAPRARAVVRRGVELIEGLGYCERLVMTLAPWELPISELHWGRWHSEESRADGTAGSLVWIRWIGPRPLHLVLKDGLELAGCDVGAGGLGGKGWRLSLDHATVLREGALGGGVLRGIPGIGKLAPARMLGALETKWLSRGIMNVEGRVAVEGWAVHEVVRFGDPV